MIIDGGLVMIFISTLIMFVPPATARAQRRPGSLKAVLNIAFPPVAPTLAFVLLIEQAETALERDALLRGTRAISTTYDLA